MMIPFFAQAGSILHYAILIIIIAGVCGIVLVVIRQAGIVIPSFVITIAWIVLAVIIGVLAIHAIMAYA